MSKINGYSHIRDLDHAIEFLDKSQVRVANLERDNQFLKRKVSEMDSRLVRCESKAQHFDILMSAVQDNKLVKATWDKFVMTLRLAGYDKSEKHD